jgi:hypothetical protein
MLCHRRFALLKPTVSIIYHQPPASFFDSTVVWATKDAQNYSSGPLKVNMEFRLTLPDVLYQFAVHANMAPHRNLHMKLQALAL